MIEPQVQKMIGTIKESLRSVQHVSFTTDIWTDSTTKESFISVTAHWINAHWQRRDHVLSCCNFPESHTGQHIADKLNQAFSEWDLGLNDLGTDKKHVIVRDGASNMRVGCNLVPLGNFHCLIHLLQLVVVDAVFAQDLLGKIIRKCRVLCTYLHNSACGTAVFRKKQTEVYGIPLSQAKQLIGDVRTRWNSSYLMLLRIQTLREALEAFMLEEAELPTSTSSWSEAKSLDANEWACIDRMVVLLEPFFKYTEIMSANKISVSLAIILVKILEMELNALSDRGVHRLKNHLQEQLTARFFSEQPSEKTGPDSTVKYNILRDTRFTVPTILHPLIKTKAFESKELRAKAQEDLTKELTQLARVNEEKRKRDEEKQRQQSSQSVSQSQKSQKPPAKKKKAAPTSMLSFLRQEDDSESGNK